MGVRRGWARDCTNITHNAQPIAHVAPISSGSDDSIICETPEAVAQPPRTRSRASSTGASSDPTPAEAEARRKEQIKAFYQKNCCKSQASPAVTRLATKLNSLAKRKAQKQTPSPVKVSDRVEAIEKKMKKKPRTQVLETLDEEVAPKSAQEKLNFDWIANKDYDSDDDFKPDSPNMLVEQARLNRLHDKAKASVKPRKSVKSKK